MVTVRSHGKMVTFPWTSLYSTQNILETHSQILKKGAILTIGGVREHLLPESTRFGLCSQKQCDRNGSQLTILRRP